MKLSSLLMYVAAVTLFFHLYLLPSTCESKLYMTVVLNDGHVLPDGHTCSDDDSRLIDNAIGAEHSNGDGDDDDDDDDDDDRRLNTVSGKCKDKCKFMTKCHSTNCPARRRELEIDPRRNRLSALLNRKLDDDDDDDDDEVNHARCEEGLDILNHEIDSILPQLSDSCRPVVEHMRTISCFDDVRYGAVESFTLWNADTDTIIQSNIQNNTAFCYTTANLNIEAIANGCVRKILIKMTGRLSTSRTISSGSDLYTAYSNSGTNIKGRRLSVGTYTIATELEGSFTPKSRVVFTIKSCS